jgi:hypothetical protein
MVAALVADMRLQGQQPKKTAHWEIKVPWLTHILDIAAD